MNLRRYLFSSCLCALLALAAITAAWANEIEDNVDKLMQPLLDRDLISGTILIAKNGAPVATKHMGLANREYNIPITADTRFRLGSMSKQFTSMAVMILHDRGLLNVGDTLSKFLPDFPNGDKITLHHLLTHSSGVVNYNNLEDYGEKHIQPLNSYELIDWFKDEPLAFEPGAQWSYSNSGYVLLSVVVEKASGQDFIEFLDENVWTPLGMDNTGEDTPTQIIPHRAQGFVNFGDSILQTPYRYMPLMRGAGSLYSTANDLLKWDQALYTDRLISPETRDLMFTDHIRGYGYGWFVGDMAGHRFVVHQGAINGFMCSIDRFIDDSVTVIALYNYESTFARPSEIRLASIALGLEFEPLLATEPVTAPREELESVTGTYALNAGVNVQVALEGDRLYFLGDEPNDTSWLEPQKPGVFFSENDNAIVQFTPDGRMILMQGAHGMQGQKQ